MIDKCEVCGSVELMLYSYNPTKQEAYYACANAVKEIHTPHIKLEQFYIAQEHSQRSRVTIPYSIYKPTKAIFDQKEIIVRSDFQEI